MCLYVCVCERVCVHVWVDVCVGAWVGACVWGVRNWVRCARARAYVCV